MLSDVALACALADDLAGAFEELVHAWSSRLFAFSLRMTGHERDAEELTEETLVRAWRALSDYSPERRRALRLRPWLFQIAANLARNRARDARRTPTFSLDDDAGETATSLAERLVDGDPLGTPEEALTAAQRQASLAALLLTLPEAQRVAVILRHIEGMCYAQIAETTGEPIGTVKSHVNRGVARLRRAMEQERLAEALEVAG